MVLFFKEKVGEQSVSRFDFPGQKDIQVPRGLGKEGKGLSRVARYVESFLDVMDSIFVCGEAQTMELHMLFFLSLLISLLISIKAR